MPLGKLACADGTMDSSPVIYRRVHGRYPGASQGDAWFNRPDGTKHDAKESRR